MGVFRDANFEIVHWYVSSLTFNQLQFLIKQSYLTKCKYTISNNFKRNIRTIPHLSLYISCVHRKRGVNFRNNIWFLQVVWHSDVVQIKFKSMYFSNIHNVLFLYYYENEQLLLLLSSLLSSLLLIRRNCWKWIFKCVIRLCSKLFI